MDKLQCCLLVIASLLYNPSAFSQPNSIIMTQANKTIELIHGQGEPTHAIIWLHGLGASANDFPPVVPELGLVDNRNIRFIFPQAPDRHSMAESKSLLDSLIEQQIEAGVPSNQIIIAGFSQGGAVAYYVGVRSEHELGGILALSTYLPFAELVEQEQSKVNIQTPILANHGTQDPVVPLQYGQDSADFLINLGYAVKWQTYPMAHQVVMEQLKDIGSWVNQTFEK